MSEFRFMYSGPVHKIEIQVPIGLDLDFLSKKQEPEPQLPGKRRHVVNLDDYKFHVKEGLVKTGLFAVNLILYSMR